MIYSYNLTKEQMWLMEAKSVITAKDAQALFDNHPRIVAGKNVMMQKYGCFAPRMVPNFKLACVRIKNEYVAEYKNSALKDLENKYVFIGILKEQSLLNELTFVWLPFCDRMYVVDEQPFEIIERPKLFSLKKKRCCFNIGNSSYDRGLYTNFRSHKVHKFLQKNLLKREFKLYRRKMVALADCAEITIYQDDNKFIKDCLQTYEPMWLLRNKPEKIDFSECLYSSEKPLSPCQDY